MSPLSAGWPRPPGLGWAEPGFGWAEPGLGWAEPDGLGWTDPGLGSARAWVEGRGGVWPRDITLRPSRRDTDSRAGPARLPGSGSGRPSESDLSRLSWPGGLEAPKTRKAGPGSGSEERGPESGPREGRVPARSPKAPLRDASASGPASPGPLVPLVKAPLRDASASGPASPGPLAMRR